MLWYSIAQNGGFVNLFSFETLRAIAPIDPIWVHYMQSLRIVVPAQGMTKLMFQNARDGGDTRIYVNFCLSNCSCVFFGINTSCCHMLLLNVSFWKCYNNFSVSRLRTAYSGIYYNSIKLIPKPHPILHSFSCPKDIDFCVGTYSHRRLRNPRCLLNRRTYDKRFRNAMARNLYNGVVLGRYATHQ